jgi:hypothetical protein
MTEEQQIAAIRRAVVNTVLNLEALQALARHSNEGVIGAVLDLAVAELESLRDPALRALAAGECQMQ